MPRAQVALVARYRSPTAFEFVEEQCSDLSSGGMFIRSTAPAPAGTLLKLECDVDDGQGLIRAVARVVWVRERDAGDEPRGMGVKFVKLEPGGRELIAAVLENVGGDEGAGVQARVSTIPPMRSSQAGNAPASAGETATSSDEAASAPSANRAGRSAERVTMREPLAAEIAAQLASIDRERAEAAKAAAASSASTAPTPSATATVAAEAATQSSTAKAPAAAQVSAKTPPTPPAPPKANAPKITTVGPAKSDPQRSGVATHRPSRRGVDMQAVAIGAALLVGVVVLAMYARQGSQRSARATQAAAPIAEVEIARVEPVAAPVAPVMAAAAAHVLQLTTLPSEARVTIGDRVATSPVTLELGVLTAPIEVRAEKEGFEPVTAAIELDRFTEQNGKRIATVMLALPAAAPAPTPIAEAAPTPEPTPAPAPSPEVAATKARRARRAAAPTTTTTVTMQPLATAQAPASAPTGSIATALAPTTATAPAPATVAPAPTPAPAATAPVPPAAATPAPAPVPPATRASAAKLTRLDAALECVGRGDNACVINTLEGKSRSSRELELLIETYRATGQSTAARRNMRDYVERFPTERRAADYAKQLE